MDSQGSRAEAGAGVADPRVLRRVQAGGTSVHPAPCTCAGDPGGAAPPRPLPRETPRRPHGKPGSLRRAVTRSPRCVSSRGDARPRDRTVPHVLASAPRARSSTNRAAWRRLPLAPTGPGLAGGPACPASRKWAASEPLRSRTRASAATPSSSLLHASSPGSRPGSVAHLPQVASGGLLLLSLSGSRGGALAGPLCP